MSSVPKVDDYRRTPRFHVDPPLRGTFDGQLVEIYNIGETGVQIEHREKFERHRFGELRFSLPFSEKTVRIEGRVAWCRMSRKKSARLHQWPYRCGIRIEGQSTISVDAFAELLRAKLLRLDTDSIDRKRRLMEARGDISPRPELSSASLAPALTLDECISRVQSARSLLRNEADFAARATAEGRARWGDRPAASDELIAIWHQLGGSVDPEIVAVVLEMNAE